MVKIVYEFKAPGSKAHAAQVSHAPFSAFFTGFYAATARLALSESQPPSLIYCYPISEMICRVHAS
jgi:hypothetical protein